MTAPGRRWFAFSLRTLFVAVTVLACSLGYELNWIRQRRQRTHWRPWGVAMTAGIVCPFFVSLPIFGYAIGCRRFGGWTIFVLLVAEGVALAIQDYALKLINS